jgi:Protein tyrosine and serine/threonine kinase
VWSWGIVVWEIFNQGALPYGNINTNAEVMEAVDGGLRLELGDRLGAEKQLAKLAAVVEDSWDRRADARPSFKLLARKCEHLFEDLTTADSSEEGDSDDDAEVVLKELQKGAYAIPTQGESATLYVKRPDLYEDEIANQSDHSSMDSSESASASDSESGSSDSSSSSSTGGLYEHQRG